MAHSILKSIAEVQSEKQKANSSWGNSIFESMENLKADYSGKIGERLLAEICKRAGLSYDYIDNDKNSRDGTYDIIILGKKVEIKTARLGVNGGFQHENLRADGCDFYALIDVTPAYFYVTIIPKFDMRAKHPVLGRTPHLRKGTTDVFKFDFDEGNLRRGVAADITLKVGVNTDVAEFIARKIGGE
jgi:hypothetical protein